MKKIIQNKYILFILLLCSNLIVFANDSIFVDKVWTERQTVFVNHVKLDSLLEDSVTEYNGIGCGSGRCIEFFFSRNQEFRKINVDGDTLLGKWKLNGDLLIIKYRKKYKGQKRTYKFLFKYRDKDYPTLYLFTKDIFDCYIFCNYK